MANYDYRWLDLFDRNPFTKELAIGIVDVHAHETETVAEAAEGIRKGLRFVRPIASGRIRTAASRRGPWTSAWRSAASSSRRRRSCARSPRQSRPDREPRGEA